MPDLAMIGSEGSHGGAITSGSSSLLLGGIGAARVGDLYACPIHGSNPIISAGTSFIKNEGMEVAAVGATTSCGATIINGYSGWNGS